jgi:hypothetical protein
MVNTQTLSPGGLSITISETAVSLAPSAAAVVLDGSNTIDLTTPSLPVIYIGPAPNITVTPTHIPIVVIVINNHAPNPTGGPATRTTITVQSSMSVYAFGSNIIYGTSTLPISAVTSAIPNTSLYTLEASAMIINSQTLVPGVEAVTLGFGSGETVRIVSWGAGGASLVVVSKGPGRVRTTTEEAEGAFITWGL